MCKNNVFIRALLIMLLSNILISPKVLSQSTPNDGNWENQYELLFNTPEAELMVRTGDIDNLGFGWPLNFDPFSGNNTPRHSYPWEIDSTDAEGTDRIMVITSYNGSPPAGQDGYTTYTSRPDNNVQPIVLTFPTDSIYNIRSAILQIFADDFQAPLWQSSFEVRLDGIRVPSYETIFNNLLQTGPIGKIVNIQVPANLLYLLNDDTLSIAFDDFSTGAGDGYAIDFVKLMINPFDITQTGTITGMVYDTGTNNPLEDVLVVANGISEGYTDSTGFFQIDSVLAGLVNIQTYKSGYGSKTHVVELSAGGNAWAQFILYAPAPEIMNVVPSDSAENVDVMTSITINFDIEMDTTTLNSSTFILSDTLETLSGTLTKTLTSLTFTPTLPLRLNMLHRASFSINARSSTGISLARDYCWEFITQEVASSVEGTSSSESVFFLFPNYPNPFIPPTSISYQLSRPGHVELSIYNSLGQNVRMLINEHQIPGQYQVQWDGHGQNGIPLENGLYLYRLRVGKFIQTRKMLMFK